LSSRCFLALGVFFEDTIMIELTDNTRFYG
jgi:hypothetical protein